MKEILSSLTRAALGRTTTPLEFVFFLSLRGMDPRTDKLS
jgi:hypothetical protein